MRRLPGLATIAGFAIVLAAALGATGTASAATTASGGTLRINLQADTDYVDPALAYYQVSWQWSTRPASSC